ncbi:uncharacterized protein LOC103155383 [Poecilia formosa]|uniref:uncharacterized protein LOC103155383 n=1 Tax=Poecilia formosa TaxID=48698 RepID=UPI0004444392|nr:PREDICTED: alanine and arginine-rich domain-containing protein [Poecilia formosa]
MDVVLTRLRDFSCKTSTFHDGAIWENTPKLRHFCPLRGAHSAGRDGSRWDIGSALARLRAELMEMRSQDQALIRQLMELHSGIQELKQELSEEEEEDTDEEGRYWDSESDGGSRNLFFCQKIHQTFYSAEKMTHRRSSVP